MLLQFYYAFEWQPSIILRISLHPLFKDKQPQPGWIQWTKSSGFLAYVSHCISVSQQCCKLEYPTHGSPSTIVPVVANEYHADIYSALLFYFPTNFASWSLFNLYGDGMAENDLCSSWLLRETGVEAKHEKDRPIQLAFNHLVPILEQRRHNFLSPNNAHI